MGEEEKGRGRTENGKEERGGREGPVKSVNQGPSK